MSRADICAVAALYALGVVDYGKVVDDRDCVGGAFTHATAAADTSGLAVLVDQSAVELAAAADMDDLGRGDELYDALGAGIHTGAAAHAFLSVDLCGVVFNGNGIELADIGAVAVADAGKGAHSVALAAEKHGRTAVAGTGIIEAKLGLFAAGAGHECDLFLGGSGIDAHDGGDLVRSLLASRNAGVNRSFALGNSSGIAVAAGVAAAAAVGTGKALADCSLLGVYFNMEYL